MCVCHSQTKNSESFPGGPVPDFDRPFLLKLLPFVTPGTTAGIEAFDLYLNWIVFTCSGNSTIFELMRIAVTTQFSLHNI